MLKSFSKLSMTHVRALFKEQSALKQLAIRGLFWSFAFYGLANVVRLASSVIMTRLLSPELFGLMNLVFIFIVGLHLFSDIGSGPNIIRSERGDDPEFLNNVWTLQVIRGGALWVGCILLAWPAAQFYNEPRLVWLLPIVGLTCFAGGFRSTSLFTLSRRMEVGRMTWFEFQNQVISTILMIALAWRYQNIWALVIGTLVSDVIKTIWSHYLIPNYRNRFAWNWQIVQGVLSFGRWIFLSTMLTFLAGQIDRLSSGKLLSLYFLGVYGVVVGLADIPRNLVGTISGRVIFPAVSQLTHLPRADLRSKLLRNRKPVLMVVALGVAVLVSFGDLAISTLYDTRYTEATWMLPLIALGIWPHILFQTLGPILIAIGKPQYESFGNFLKLLFTGIGIPLGFSFLGVFGVIMVVVLNDLPLYGAIAYGLQREGLNSLGQDAQLTGLLIILLAVIVASRYALGFGFPISGLFAALPG